LKEVEIQFNEHQHLTIQTNYLMWKVNQSIIETKIIERRRIINKTKNKKRKKK